MTYPEPKRVLLLSIPEEVRAKLSPLLRRSSLEVSRLATPSRALELLGEVPFHLVVTSHPLPEVSLPRFIKKLRARTCASRAAGLMVITRDPSHLDVTDLVGRGVNRILPATEPGEVLVRHAGELLAVTPRARARVLVRAEVTCGKPGASFLAQTENISATGALIRSQRHPPIGSHLPLKLQLPDDPRPIECTGEVVRHADPVRENVTGFAVRFLDLTPAQRRRLEQWVAAHLDDRA